MPHINRQCRQTACPVLVQSPATYCPAHVCTNSVTRHRQEYDKSRTGLEHRQIYKTVRWAKIRAYRIADFPFCEMADLCVRRTGRPAPSTDVHHIKGVVVHPELAFEYDNLQATCHECHSAHTARTEGWAKKRDTEEQ